ncbi:hypothetical protein GCM10023148_49860 [Actinokineospora soli]
MLGFAEVVAVSAAVGSTRSRLAKVDALAGLLTAADRAEVPAVVAFKSDRSHVVL